MARQRHTVPGDTRLRDSQDKAVSIRWPIALDKRLDDLVDRANASGENTSRRELLAALLLDADHTGEELGYLLRTYRTAAADQAPLEVDRDDGNVLSFEAHKPGPRTRRTR